MRNICHPKIVFAAQLCGVAACLLSLLPAQGQEKSPEQLPAINGWTLVSVHGSELALRFNEHHVNVQTTTRTEIWKHGKDVSLKSLKQGDEIFIDFDGKDGRGNLVARIVAATSLGGGFELPLSPTHIIERSAGGGTLMAIGEDTITVDRNHTIEKYYVPAGADLFRGWRIRDIHELKIGDKAVVALRDYNHEGLPIVTQLVANATKAEGRVVSVNLEAKQFDVSTNDDIPKDQERYYPSYPKEIVVVTFEARTAWFVGDVERLKVGANVQVSGLETGKNDIGKRTMVAVGITFVQLSDR